MQKILFSRDNAEKISSQALDVCNVYNQLSKVPILREDILNAFAKAFGYESGWAEFMAVNKSTRYYISFSMSVCSHVRAFISEITKFLPTHFEAELFLVAVSYIELKVKTPSQYHRIHAIAAFEAGEFVMWFTKNLNTPLRYLSQSPCAALVERQGILFKFFEELWPELHSHLKLKYQFSPEQVLLFERPVWSDYGDRFCANYQNSELGQWQIHFKDSTSTERVCYDPIYDEGGSNIVENLAIAVKNGLSGCPHMANLTKSLTSEKYVLACLNDWKKLPHIMDIKFSFKSPHMRNAHNQVPADLMEYLIDHNEAMDFIRNYVTKMDFTEEIWGYEPRYIHNNNGSRHIYQEPWLVASDIESFITVNEKIHQSSLIYHRSSLIHIWEVIDTYQNEVFSSV